ncbi:hypothetical protein HED54_14985 [Ochrobactrum anthropi ATCC 49188]|nr:hypothetical protein [Brucella anthropi ATCC 49188]
MLAPGKTAPERMADTVVSRIWDCNPVFLLPSMKKIVGETASKPYSISESAITPKFASVFPLRALLSNSVSSFCFSSWNNFDGKVSTNPNSRVAPSLMSNWTY